MKAAIIQSSYLPWKGYFDIINEADTFVFLEDVQYTKRDWRNRNKIKTPGGSKWIVVPIATSIDSMICEAKIDYTQDWREEHRKAIHHSYARSEYYESYKEDILSIYDDKYSTISDLNIFAIRKISGLLGINTTLLDSVDLKTSGRKEDKLIEICQKIGADHYVSGPAARSYIDEQKFAKAGISLQYKDYSGYPEYRQLWGEFDHYVSIIDLIFNCGENASHYVWGWREPKSNMNSELNSPRDEQQPCSP